MSEVKIIQTTPSELCSIVSNSVKKVLEEFHKEQSKSNSKDILLSRQETCDFLGINLSTLWHWTKKEKLTSKKIGNRVYYLKSDILEALNS